MSQNETKAGDLWNQILESDDFLNFDVSSFKNEGANNRITQYSIKTHGMFFLKNILFHMAQSLGESKISVLKKINQRHVGGGIAIEQNGFILDLDYLMVAEEIDFLTSIMGDVRSIVEIGAGYGRTCHGLLSFFPNIEKYVIVDLPPMLNLSHRYLKEVSEDNNFRKINFVRNDQINDECYDLAINIDSMQEMDESVVGFYLNFIDKHCLKFFCKNTVGKFDPSIGGWQETSSSRAALNSGILKDKINIFDPFVLTQTQENFLKEFSPGNEWQVTKHATTLPWTHYYQAVFSKHV